MSQIGEFFGLNVKELMRLHDRTPSWLADKSGLSPMTVFRILDGKTEPGLNTVEKIAKVFDVEPSSLIMSPDKKAALAKHKEKTDEHAEMRRLIRLQIENDLLVHSLGKITSDIETIKNLVTTETKNVASAVDARITALEKEISEKAHEIEDQKSRITHTEKLVRIFDGTPESLQKLQNSIGKNLPLSDMELLEAQTLVDLAEEILGPLPSEMKETFSKAMIEAKKNR